MNIIYFRREKKKLSTKEHQESNENEKIYYICKENLENKNVKDRKHCKVRDLCHFTGAAHSICSFKYSVPKEIPIAFQN